jgi:diguanylate cyclase (GGDEF)-like protein/PAS domain S-box-containing protein
VASREALFVAESGPVPDKIREMNMSSLALASQSLSAWQSFFRPLLRNWLVWFGAPLLLVLVAPPLGLFGQAYASIHLVLELAAVAVSFLVFAVAWNMYPRNRQIVPLLAGCGFLVVALLDLFHLLSYPGMPDWITANAGNDKAIALWLAAREVAALVLLGVVTAPRRSAGAPTLRPMALLTALVIALLLGLGIVFAVRAVPGIFFGTTGLTPLKIAGECLVVATLCAALFLLARRPLPANVSCDAGRLGAALLTMIAAEILFMQYREADDLVNLVGHLYKVGAYYQLYQALFIGMVQEPFRRMEAAESELRQNEANLAALFEASPDGIFVLDRHGTIVRANQQAAAMFGYTGDALLGRSHLDLLPEARRAMHDALVQDYFATQQPSLMGAGRRLTALRRDGMLFPVEVGLSPVVLAGEMHVIATVRDVGVRDQLERQLEASESRLRNFLDNAVDWMWEVDTAGLYTYASQSVHALLGYAPEDVIGRAPLDFMPADEAWRSERIWRDCVARRAPIMQLESQYRHCDGRLLTLETSGLPYGDGSSDFLGYRGISRDVTRRNEIRLALKQSEQRFRLAFDLSPIGMAISDPRGRFLHVNATLAAMLGYEEAEFCCLVFADLAHPDDYAASSPWRQALFDGRVPAATIEIRYRHKNGAYIWSQTSIAVAGTPGRVDYLLTQIRDITEERNNRERNARLLAIIDRTEDAIGTMSQGGRLTYLNPAARRLLGIALDEDISMCRLADFHPPEIAVQIFERAVPLANRHGIWEGETLWRSREGDDIPMWQVVMAHKDAAGEVDYWSTVARDLREIRQWQDRLAYQDTHDMLTALPNRYLVRDRLQQAMANARRSGRLVAVMVIDIDHFKRINDGMGHASGDTVLLELAQRLRQSLRESDTLARQGGDEFIALLPDVALVQDIVAIADKLNACFEAPIPLGERDLYITASNGIAVFPFDEDNDDELLRKAEVAMYRAKELGRNTYQFYTSDMDQRYREDLEVEVDLRHAIERDELLLHYQPKFCLADGQLTGFEALLRWRHPKRGLIQPGRFIPVAERSNLIVSLGEWTLRAACRQMVSWLQDGFDPGHIAVNVSALQFAYSDVAAMVRQVLDETGLAPQRLELEITESILMRDPVITGHLLDELKAIDVGIAIDDFGTGYSSLSYLKRFPVDVLKIDRAFVQDVAINEDDAAIVRAVISMANALGIGVVAEGVETQEQHAFLRECGCDLVQGYLFGRPVDAAASLERLQQHRGSTTTR